MSETGRNDPCPCGSGKKYKKCCFGEEPIEAPAVIDEKREEAKFLYQALNNLHGMLLERKPHIREYKKIRRLHSEIIDSMAAYHDAGKFEQKADEDVSIPASGTEGKDEETRRTLILLESDFNMEETEGAQGFYEMLIYKTAPNMNCITEEYLQKHIFKKPEKVELLQCMLASRVGLFETMDTDPDEGYAHLREVFTGEEYTITDIGLSGSQGAQRFYIYTRIITCRGISFGTGLNLLFAKKDPFIQDFIERERKNYMPLGEVVRFITLYNRFSKDHSGIDVLTNTF